jgi:ubiquinone/menaquinone biosynthesis C-methylase UbiE
MKNSYHLPKKNILSKTSSSDPMEWYFKPLFGFAYRKRLSLALDSLGNHHDKLLEIGHASGILLPELSRRCNELHAIDIHENNSMVQKMLDIEKVDAKLKTGSILNLEYSKQSFDALICLSVLEFMNKQELITALKEIHRITKDGGKIILGFPKYSKLSDLAFRTLGLKSTDLYNCDYTDIEKAIRHEFSNTHISLWPSFSKILSIYAIAICKS